MASYPIINTGTGRNAITLLISENAWANHDKISDANGDAQFLVFVNGVQQGGTFTALAPHATSNKTTVTKSPGEQTFNFLGDFGQAPTVQVKFINDAYRGTPVTDRNLYVDSVSYDGSNQHESASLLANGAANFLVASPKSPVNIGTGPDTVSLQISETAWANHDKISDGNGDAEFTVTINGVKQGGTFRATATHGSSGQTFNFNGAFGVNPTVQVTFINDAYGGSSSADRNLFVDAVNYDGVDQDKSAALYSNGPAQLQLAGGSSPGGAYQAVSTGSGPDNVTLQISEDAWANGDGTSDSAGDAQFTVSVNGARQGGIFTALAPHASGAEQNFVFNGRFGANPTFSISFLNDAFGGSGSMDRNLYVDSVSYDGVNQNDSAEMLSNQTVNLQLQGGTTSGGGGGTTPGPGFYVSTTGNDSGDGSQTSPFRTLGRAQQAMQQSSIKTTYIKAGTYALGAWSLTSADNGERWLPAQGQSTVTLDGAGRGYVDASRVNNLTIEGLTFQNMGVGPHGAGMYLNGSNETIRWNTFLNSYQEAITGANLQNSLIDSNTINGVGPGNPPGVTTFAYTAIDLWYGSSGNTISHNLIENAQGGGISIATGASDPPDSNNVIDSNKLVNVNTSVFDIGAIYIEDRTHLATGNKITNNVINGYGNGSLSDQTKGIYLDDVTSNVTITGNLLYGTPGEWGMQIHGGDHNVVRNNIFALSPGEQVGLYQDYTGSTGMNGNDFQSNIVYYSSQPPDPLWHWSGSGIAAPTNTTNLYYSADGSRVPNDGSIIDSNPYYADPQFQNAGGGYFSMPSSSPAYLDIGWHPLSTNQGPLPPQF